LVWLLSAGPTTTQKRPGGIPKGGGARWQSWKTKFPPEKPNVQTGKDRPARAGDRGRSERKNLKKKRFEWAQRRRGGPGQAQPLQRPSQTSFSSLSAATPPKGEIRRPHHSSQRRARGTRVDELHHTRQPGKHRPCHGHCPSSPFGDSRKTDLAPGTRTGLRGAGGHGVPAPGPVGRTDRPSRRDVEGSKN